jgi:hypothetical protein
MSKPVGVRTQLSDTAHIISVFRTSGGYVGCMVPSRGGNWKAFDIYDRFVGEHSTQDDAAVALLLVSS